MSELSSAQLNELFQGEFSCIEGMSLRANSIDVQRRPDIISMTSITDHEEAKNMWSTYTKEVNKYDESVTTAQRDDANSVLVFVRYCFLLPSDVHRNDGLKRPVSFPQSSLFLLSKAIRSCLPTLATGLRFFSSRFHSSSLVSRMTHIHRLRASHHFPPAPPFSGSTFCGF